MSILLRCKTPRFRAQPAESISDYENNALINMHDTAKSDYSVSSTLPSPYPTIKKLLNTVCMTLRSQTPRFRAQPEESIFN